jgi:uncharacterized membrane protein
MNIFFSQKGKSLLGAEGAASTSRSLGTLIFSKWQTALEEKLEIASKEDYFLHFFISELFVTRVYLVSRAQDEDLAHYRAR